MNEVIMNSRVVTSLKGKAISFVISGQGHTLNAIQAMVLAHAVELYSFA
jgi:predicted RNA-binding protein Jag